MKKILLVLIDGMRKDYINQEDTPFLFSKLNKGILVEELVKEAVFCERSEIYTGENSQITGNYAAFTFDPDKSPYKGLRKFGKIRNLTDFFGYTLPKKMGGRPGLILYKIHKKLRRYIQNYILKENGFSMNDIPSKFLDLFRLTEDHLPYDNANSFNCPTIFDSLKKNGLTWCNYFDDLRVSENKLSRDERLERIIKSFSSPHSLFLFADSEIDAFGHIKGTSREARKNTVRKVDGIMKKLHDAFLEINQEGIIIFFSPHGMMDVEKVFDPESRLKQFIKENKLKVPKDVVFFIDSTMVRVWGPKSNKLKSLFRSEPWSTFGTFVSPEIASRYNIHANNDEVIWWTNPGICNFPDFFRRYSAPKGMHGYFMNVKEMNGFAIVLGKNLPLKTIYSDYLKNLKATIEDLLLIPLTEGDKKRSWLNMGKHKNKN